MWFNSHFFRHKLHKPWGVVAWTHHKHFLRFTIIRDVPHTMEKRGIRTDFFFPEININVNSNCYYTFTNFLLKSDRRVNFRNFHPVLPWAPSLSNSCYAPELDTNDFLHQIVIVIPCQIQDTVLPIRFISLCTHNHYSYY